MKVDLIVSNMVNRQVALMIVVILSSGKHNREEISLTPIQLLQVQRLRRVQRRCKCRRRHLINLQIQTSVIDEGITGILTVIMTVMAMMIDSGCRMETVHSLGGTPRMLTKIETNKNDLYFFFLFPFLYFFRANAEIQNRVGWENDGANEIECVCVWERECGVNARRAYCISNTIYHNN